MDIDSLDYFSDPLLALDPYGLLDYLAANKPVYLEPHHGVVMVTGYEEVLTVLRSPDTYSSATVVAGTDPMGLLPERPTGDDIHDFLEHKNPKEHPVTATAILQLLPPLKPESAVA